MSAETFTTAMFLITAVIAAGVLINAVFPVVYNMAGTFSSATHESDDRLRTDFKIITYLAHDDAVPYVEVWMKNIGSSRISVTDITSRADVFCGKTGAFERLTYSVNGGDDHSWTEVFNQNPDKNDINGNNYWDPGETLLVKAYSSKISTDSTDSNYFQFILPNGVSRSTEFTV
jgi:flagellar protein FlaG